MRLVASFVCLAAAGALAQAALAQETDAIAQHPAVVRLLTAQEADEHPPYGRNWVGEVGLVLGAGQLVTNIGIAKYASQIVAIAADGSRHAAVLAGIDDFSNLALYRISGWSQPAPREGDATALRTGESLYAISPTRDGRRRAVASQVRNPKRVLRTARLPVGPYLEIDNRPGEVRMEGPVFQQDGALVGFVVLRTSSEQKTQVTLALPMDHVRHVAGELEVYGKVRRSRIGATLRRVPGDGAGMLIDAIAQRGPADRAGLLAGDVIVGLAGKTIVRDDDYYAAIQRIRAGTNVAIEVLRGNERRVLELRTGEVTSGPQVGQPAKDDRKLLIEDD